MPIMTPARQVPAAAHPQTTHAAPRLHPRPSPLALAVAFACLFLAGLQPSRAQLVPQASVAPAAAPGQGSGRVVPTLTLSESYLSTSGTLDGGSRGEFITRVSPGLSWASRSGRLQGSVNYVADLSLYSRRNDGTQFTNNLNANVRGVVVQDRVFVDVQAFAGQTNISAFGRQSGTDTFGNNPNRTETTSLRVSPTVVGNLGNWADYTLRATAFGTNSKGFSAANTSGWSSLANVRSVPGRGPFGWGLTALASDTEYQNRSSVSNERVFGEVNARLLGNDMLLFATAGQERSNLLDRNGRTYDTWSAGLRWAPTVRTSVSAETERRFYGTGHRFQLQHRTPQTALRYSDVQDTIDNTGLAGLSTGLTLFQLYFFQFASSIPDPIARERAVLDFIRLTLGRNPNDLASVTTLVSGLSLQRRQDLAGSWIGKRLTLTLGASAVEVRLLDPAAATAPGVRPEQLASQQRGVTGSFAYLVSGATTFNGSVSRQWSSGSGVALNNRLNAVSLGLSSQMTPRVRLGVSGRLARFSSTSDPYREALISANLTMRF